MARGRCEAIGPKPPVLDGGFCFRVELGGEEEEEGGEEEEEEGWA